MFEITYEVYDVVEGCFKKQTVRADGVGIYKKNSSEREVIFSSQTIYCRSEDLCDVTMAVINFMNKHNHNIKIISVQKV